jgi:hypothetical protein
MKISFGLLAGCFFDRALDAYLPLEIGPEEIKTGSGVERQISGFAAAVIGKKEKSPLGDTLEQDDANGRLARGVDRGEGHRVGVLDTGGDSLTQPAVELRDRIRIEIGAAQVPLGVLLAQGCNIQGGRVHVIKMYRSSRLARLHISCADGPRGLNRLQPLERHSPSLFTCWAAKDALVSAGDFLGGEVREAGIIKKPANRARIGIAGDLAGTPMVEG